MKMADDKKKKILHSFVQERKELHIFERESRDEKSNIMNDTADEEHARGRRQQQHKEEAKRKKSGPRSCKTTRKGKRTNRL